MNRLYKVIRGILIALMLLIFIYEVVALNDVTDETRRNIEKNENLIPNEQLSKEQYILSVEAIIDTNQSYFLYQIDSFRNIKTSVYVQITLLVIVIGISFVIRKSNINRHTVRGNQTKTPLQDQVK